ncbi:hypothetical protein HYPSUDRAFT_128461 [Hypholoma sublateritium FD-334 SS-4]|uniref:Uncharacterized protein n=1 Tax=Hypholoma sublateritium (strain FD-334 SS-4) TaxID=945553 RepID=A0A0D2PDY4_HYPSF|nr:hypothetical protein HYPSUDRAFT_128461 [Hypholoma sublateritium FD-334 SS-4]
MSKLDFKKVFEQEEARLRILHPTPEDIPGCISVFDDYLGCSVIRNQVKSIYRYGKRSSCDQKLDEFKFCLTLKVMHPEEQREAWIRRRAEWWAHRRIEQSSEDVWDIRDKPLPNFPKPITTEMMQEAGF